MRCCHAAMLLRAASSGIPSRCRRSRLCFRPRYEASAAGWTRRGNAPTPLCASAHGGLALPQPRLASTCRAVRRQRDVPWPSHTCSALVLDREWAWAWGVCVRACVRAWARGACVRACVPQECHALIARPRTDRRARRQSPLCRWPRLRPAHAADYRRWGLLAAAPCVSAPPGCGPAPSRAGPTYATTCSYTAVWCLECHAPPRRHALSGVGCVGPLTALGQRGL
jgi:hypothetical protein